MFWNWYEIIVLKHCVLSVLRKPKSQLIDILSDIHICIRTKTVITRTNQPNSKSAGKRFTTQAIKRSKRN